MYDGVTQTDRHTRGWKCAVATKADLLGKSGRLLTLRVARKCGFGQANLLILHCQEKPLRSGLGVRTANQHR